MKFSVSSLQKGLEILCSFDLDSHPLSARTISQRLKLPLSTTYRYLMTLEKMGFMVKDRETKNFRLGIRLLKLGNTVLSQTKLVDIVLPYMESLSSQTGETVFLTVISGWESVCIEKVETRRFIKLSLERGLCIPLYATASAKILLAYQTHSFIDGMLRNVGLIKFTKNTITDPVLLRKELKKIRRQGYAFSDQELDLGARAIGAPILNHRGEVIAGLTIAGPKERITGKNKLSLILLLKEAARKASQEMGYQVPE